MEMFDADKVCYNLHSIVIPGKICNQVHFEFDGKDWTSSSFPGFSRKVFP